MHPDLKRDSNNATISVFAADPYGFGHNDLQPVAQAICPEINNALMVLKVAGFKARMTGSGSAVFAHYAANTQEIKVPDSFLLRHCSNLDVHPLSGWTVQR
jgi:4-diphosphocytidyl-2-C-methyl-D-erythritol kinase